MHWFGCSRLFKSGSLCALLLLSATATAFAAGSSPHRAHVSKQLGLRLANGAAVDALVTLRRPVDRSPRALGPWQQAIHELQEQTLRCVPALREKVLRRYEAVPMLFVRLDPGQLEALAACETVTALSENRMNQRFLAQSIPLIDGDVAVRDYGLDGFSTTVAILDTGANYKLSELGGCFGKGCKVVAGHDFGSGDSDPMDCDTSFFHGSNVAAIAAGTRGVAFGANIAALKVFGGSCNEAADDSIASALDWVVKNRATYNIVSANLSLGYYGTGYASACDHVVPGAFTAALDTVNAAGVLVVVAAGNDGFADQVSYPSCLENAMAVANVYDALIPGALCWGGTGCPSEDNLCVDENIRAGKIVCSSNGGSLIDVSAPGALIEAAGVNIGGTSQASPHVAGVAALLHQANAAVTLPQLWSYLRTTSDTTTDSRSTTSGPYEYPRVNVNDALAALDSDIGIDEDPDQDGYDVTVDCNSLDSAVNPGATETCNSLDDNCDGEIDEGFDKDGDGYFPKTCTDGQDCDDSNSDINPKAEEVRDGADNNCDGQVDEGTGGCGCGTADNQPNFGLLFPGALLGLGFLRLRRRHARG